jgi:hypothetical protein
MQGGGWLLSLKADEENMEMKGMVLVGRLGRLSPRRRG